jgi:hypothetical protein
MATIPTALSSTSLSTSATITTSYTPSSALPTSTAPIYNEYSLTELINYNFTAPYQ